MRELLPFTPLPRQIDVNKCLERHFWADLGLSGDQQVDGLLLEINGMPHSGASLMLSVSC